MNDMALPTATTAGVSSWCNYLHDFPDYYEESTATPDHFADALTDSAAPGLHAHTPEEVLAKLNEERNPAKHNPNSAVSHWLRDHWECVAYLIEKLTGHVA